MDTAARNKGLVVSKVVTMNNVLTNNNTARASIYLEIILN